MIELIVVMAAIGILVLLAAPRFIGQTKEATFTKHINNAKVLEDASERYYIDHGKWPRGADEEVYTAEEVDAYAERIYDITGEEIALEDGNYWDIDYAALGSYAKLPDESERANYILRNPVGKVFYLEGLTEEGQERLPIDTESNDEMPEGPEEPAIPDYYVQATDADFTKDTSGYWRYIGTDDYVILPHEINGVPVTSYKNMFRGTSSGGVTSSPVKGVVSTNPNVTNMYAMFYNSQATTLDLRSFNTANVTDMGYMFSDSQVTTLDLSSFNTANVTNMGYMFSSSQATTLNLSSFDTSKLTDMGHMFYYSKATSLDLSSFDTSNVTNMYAMFYYSKATTLDLSSFNTANVTNMGHMFSGSNATTLDLSSFNTANVTAMNSMFNGSNATTLDLSSFNTANVADMSWMFSISKATTLDLSSFNTANVTDMRYMFQGIQATTLDLSSFNTANVTNKDSMFSGAKATTGYARTQNDANKFNNSSYKPTSLKFIVKP